MLAGRCAKVWQDEEVEINAELVSALEKERGLQPTMTGVESSTNDTSVSDSNVNYKSKYVYILYQKWHINRNKKSITYNTNYYFLVNNIGTVLKTSLLFI